MKICRGKYNVILIFKPGRLWEITSIAFLLSAVSASCWLGGCRTPCTAVARGRNRMVKMGKLVSVLFNTLIIQRNYAGCVKPTECH